MGASESTAKTNGTGDDEEKSQQESAESSMGGGKAVALAAAGVAAAGVAAWGISRMLSENTDSQQKDGYPGGKSEILEGKCSSWSPPPPPTPHLKINSHFKINTDGRCHSVRGRSYECPQVVPEDAVERRPSGYGGILRDHRGNWVRGFKGSIGVTDSFTAELHGIHKGLMLLDKLGHKGAILESDCKAAVNWINETYRNTSKSKIIRDSWDIIVECRDLAQNNNTTVNHIKGEDNQCAHKLADLAIGKEHKYVEIQNLSELPDEIRHLVDKDAKIVF